MSRESKLASLILGLEVKAGPKQESSSMQAASAVARGAWSLVDHVCIAAAGVAGYDNGAMETKEGACRGSASLLRETEPIAQDLGRARQRAIAVLIDGICEGLPVGSWIIRNGGDSYAACLRVGRNGLLTLSATSGDKWKKVAKLAMANAMCVEQPDRIEAETDAETRERLRVEVALCRRVASKAKATEKAETAAAAFQTPVSVTE